MVELDKFWDKRMHLGGFYVTIQNVHMLSMQFAHFQGKFRMKIRVVEGAEDAKWVREKVG
jgi:hypothetical protein